MQRTRPCCTRASPPSADGGAKPQPPPLKNWTGMHTAQKIVRSSRPSLLAQREARRSPQPWWFGFQQESTPLHELSASGMSSFIARLMGPSNYSLGKLLTHLPTEGPRQLKKKRFPKGLWKTTPSK